MAQNREVRGVATNIRTENGTTHVRYHYTDVVSFNEDTIVLRSGGWQTVTTKARMNQTANQFGLNFSVFQRKGSWFVDFNGETLDFSDGMTLQRKAQAA